MGSRVGPNYACLFVGYIEERIRSTLASYLNYTSATLMKWSELHSVVALNWRILSNTSPVFIQRFSSQFH